MFSKTYVHLKYSLLGSAMLVMAGCSIHPSTTADSSSGSDAYKKRITHANAKSQAHKTHLAKATHQSNSNKIERVTWCARKQQGKLYCWGGSNPNTGFDCSGLTQYAFKQGAGVNLPRTAAEQYRSAIKVRHTEAQKGDLVFFRTRGKRVSHVGIYLGEDKFIHAPRAGKSITTSRLSGYWKQRLVGFGRVPGVCRPTYS